MSPVDYGCPDCRKPAKSSSGAVIGYTNVPCGLTPEEHKRVAKAREEAKKQARELMVQGRIDEQLPRSQAPHGRPQGRLLMICPFSE